MNLKKLEHPIWHYKRDNFFEHWRSESLFGWNLIKEIWKFCFRSALSSLFWTLVENIRRSFKKMVSKNRELKSGKCYDFSIWVIFSNILSYGNLSISKIEIKPSSVYLYWSNPKSSPHEFDFFSRAQLYEYMNKYYGYLWNKVEL